VLNIEIKVRCDELEGVLVRALALDAADEGVLHQEDEFFRTNAGRLKLRTQDGEPSELITYLRPDSPDPSPSEWNRYRTTAPAELRGVLTQALGTEVTVRKDRHLLVLEHTRIHLDTVEDLGTFVELETTVDDGIEVADAQHESARIATALGLDSCERVSVAYADLLRSPR